MTRDATATLLAALCLGAGCLHAPTAEARSGGDALGGTPAGDDSGSSRAREGSSTPARGGDEPSPSRSPGLLAGPGALLGRAQRVSGTMDGAPAGRTVLLQLGQPSSGWSTVAQTRTVSGGSFSALWRASRTGRFTLRAMLSGSSRARASRGPLTAEVTVYAPAIATQFGPGFYGRRTACGTLLGPETMGVAHRTLPCGTRLEFFHGGRRATLAVVDRGPYVTGVTWDLTTAAARSFGFSGRGYVGTMPLGARAGSR